LGLVGDGQWDTFTTRKASINQELQRLESTYIQPGSAQAEQLTTKIKNPLVREYSLADLLRRPELEFQDVATLSGESYVSTEHAAEQVATQIKYAGYIERQAQDIAKLHRQESLVIPEDIDFANVRGLSNEIQQKLTASRPSTIARAGRISGVTPAALSLLLVYIKRKDGMKNASNG
jgi:tRNA uridine 5-carboxymethylaminomethyl modification enzyme